MKGWSGHGKQQPAASFLSTYFSPVHVSHDSRRPSTGHMARVAASPVKKEISQEMP